MHISKEKVAKCFLDNIGLSNGKDFYSKFTGFHVEERLNLGSYGILDLFFYKKDILDGEEIISIIVVTISQNLIGFEDILKTSKVKIGSFKYIREHVGILDKKIFYSNYILFPGFKDYGFELLVKDIPDLQTLMYDFNSSGFVLYECTDKIKRLVPSGKVLKTIKRRLS